MFARYELGRMIRLAGPAAVSCVSFAVMDIIDCIILAMMGVDSMAGAVLAISITALVMAFSVNMLRALAPVTAARAGALQGRSEWKASLGSLARLALAAGVVLGAVSALVCLAISAGLDDLGYQPGLVDTARTYLIWRSAGIPFELVFVAGWALLEGLGDTRSPLKAGIVSNICNLVLSFGLVSGCFGLPALGVEAVALATNISSLIGVGMLGKAISKKFDFIQGIPKNFGLLRSWWGAMALGFEKDALRALLRIGGPLGVVGLSNLIGVTLLAVLVARLGPQASAAHGVFLRLLALGLATAEGLGVAATTLVAHAIGAGRKKTANRKIHLIIGSQVLSGSVLVVLMIWLGGCLMTQMSQEFGPLGLLFEMSSVVAAVLWLEGLLVVVASVLEGCGRTRVLMLAAVVLDVGFCGILYVWVGLRAELETYYQLWLVKNGLKLGCLLVWLAMASIHKDRSFRVGFRLPDW